MTESGLKWNPPILLYRFKKISSTIGQRLQGDLLLLLRKTMVKVTTRSILPVFLVYLSTVTLFGYVISEDTDQYGVTTGEDANNATTYQDNVQLKAGVFENIAELLFIDPPQMPCFYDDAGFFCNVWLGKKGTRRLYITTQSSHLWVFDDNARGKIPNFVPSDILKYNHKYYDKKSRSRSYKPYHPPPGALPQDGIIHFRYMDGSSYSGMKMATERIRIGRRWNKKALMTLVDTIEEGSRTEMDGFLGLGTHPLYAAESGSSKTDVQYTTPEFLRIAKKTIIGETIFSLYLNPRRLTEEENQELKKQYDDQDNKGGGVRIEDVTGRLRFGSELPVECYDTASLTYVPILPKYRGWVVNTDIQLGTNHVEAGVKIEMDFGSRYIRAPPDFIDKVTSGIPGGTEMLTREGKEYLIMLKSGDTCKNREELLHPLVFTFHGSGGGSKISVALTPTDYITERTVEVLEKHEKGEKQDKAGLRKCCVLQIAPIVTEGYPDPTPTMSLGRPFFKKAFSTYNWDEREATGSVGIAHSREHTKSPSHPWPAATTPSYSNPDNEPRAAVR